MMSPESWAAVDEIGARSIEGYDPVRDWSLVIVGALSYQADVAGTTAEVEQVKPLSPARPSPPHLGRTSSNDPTPLPATKKKTTKKKKPARSS